MLNILAGFHSRSESNMYDVCKCKTLFNLPIGTSLKHILIMDTLNYKNIREGN